MIGKKMVGGAVVALMVLASIPSVEAQEVCVNTPTGQHCRDVSVGGGGSSYMGLINGIIEDVVDLVEDLPISCRPVC